MSTLANRTQNAKCVLPWQLELSQVLEEHHVCATSDDAALRRNFVEEATGHLALLDDSDVCVLKGADIRDLATLGEALGQSLGVQEPVRSLDGVVRALRRRSRPGGVRPAKRRYLIWTEAHALLRADPGLFGRAVDSMMGVAAEGEFASEDLLLLQRCVFVGRSSLDVYAEDPRGQLRSWLSERGEVALWRVVSGQEQPRVHRLRIDAVRGMVAVAP